MVVSMVEWLAERWVVKTVVQTVEMSVDSSAARTEDMTVASWVWMRVVPRVNYSVCLLAVRSAVTMESP